MNAFYWFAKKREKKKQFLKHCPPFTGILVNFDINTADASFQARYRDCPDVEQPLLAATWEVNSYDAVDTLMELRPDTSVLYQPLPEQPARPLFFHVSASSLR